MPTTTASVVVVVVLILVVFFVLEAVSRRVPEDRDSEIEVGLFPPRIRRKITGANPTPVGQTEAPPAVLNGESVDVSRVADRAGKRRTPHHSAGSASQRRFSSQEEDTSDFLS